MDSFAANKRFAEDIGVKFPLLSDWKRQATKDYGLYNEASGYGSRATFVINKEGIIQHVEVGRPVGKLFRLAEGPFGRQGHQLAQQPPQIGRASCRERV